MRYEARVEIAHLPGIADPQGATIERSLPALGYDNVTQVRVGKSIRLVVEAPDEAAARAQVEEMCHRLLANPVIEAYTVGIETSERAQSSSHRRTSDRGPGIPARSE
jgi:phosphoribosylformylglycinamidine synthase